MTLEARVDLETRMKRSGNYNLTVKSSAARNLANQYKARGIMPHINEPECIDCVIHCCRYAPEEVAAESHEHVPVQIVHRNSRRSQLYLRGRKYRTRR